MPGVLGAPPGVTFNSTRSITTNGIVDHLEGVNLNGPNHKKRRNLHPKVNGLSNGLSSRGAAGSGALDDDDDDEELGEEWKDIKGGIRDVIKDIQTAVSEREKQDEEDKAEAERQAKEKAEAEEKERKEKEAAKKAAEEKQQKEKDDAAKAAAAAAASGKDDATIHLKQYNEARAKVYADMDRFRDSLKDVLELLANHVHPEDWVKIMMHNQSARQFNASIDDRYSTKLAALRNAKGLVQETEVTIDQLEQLEPTEKLQILEKLGSTHVFPSPAEGAGQDKKDQYFRLLTNQLRVAVGLSSNAGP